MTLPGDIPPGVPAGFALPEATAEQTEHGRKLFVGDVTFMLGAAGLDQIPDHGLNEIAFAGRSNVGKSSLINALLNRNDMARTSNTPGRTQQINFFNLGDRLVLADLPGYGYAKAPKSEVQKWTRMVNAYLRGRQDLRRACVLIDARHGLKKVDREIMEMLDTAAQPYQLVLTKCDKVKAGAVDRLVEQMAKEFPDHPAAYPFVGRTSSRKSEGIPALRAELAQFAAGLD